MNLTSEPTMNNELMMDSTPESMIESTPELGFWEMLL